MNRRNWRLICKNCERLIKLTREEAHDNYVICPHCNMSISLRRDNAKTLNEALINSLYFPHTKTFLREAKRVKKLINY